MSFWSRWRSWRKDRLSRKEARQALREARRILRRYAHRLTDGQSSRLRHDIRTLSEAVVARDARRIGTALVPLGEQLRGDLAFARKSAAREYAESLGSAVFVVLFLRAFVVEAFQIPSGSMIPTLQVGDRIFVNKFVYGLRIPFTNIKFAMNVRKPRRGEVIVFVHPKEPEKDLIKRVVAVEGDSVEVRDNVLYVNGSAVPRERLGPVRYDDFEEDERWVVRHGLAWRETLGGRSFTTLFRPDGRVGSFPVAFVPPGAVFVMGDNRDNSSDSRYWGFVPLELVKGQAMFVLFSWGEPEGIRLRRFGQPLE